MVWNDKRISDWAQAGGVTPFDATCVNPASLDLRIGDLIRVPKHTWIHEYPEWRSREVIDKSTPSEILWEDARGFDSYELIPGQFVLCHSMEYLRIPDDAVGTLYSKSSTGRIGLEHLHSGYFDCSFFGQATFEFHNAAPWPIRLRPGDRFVQLRLEQMIGLPAKSYKETGRYNGQTGPTPAREKS